MSGTLASQTSTAGIEKDPVSLKDTLILLNHGYARREGNYSSGNKQNHTWGEPLCLSLQPAAATFCLQLLFTAPLDKESSSIAIYHIDILPGPRQGGS